MRSARLSAYFGNNALTNLGPRLRSTRECKEPGGGPRVIQSLSDVSDLGLSRPRVLYIPWFVGRSCVAACGDENRRASFANRDYLHFVSRYKRRPPTRR